MPVPGRDLGRYMDPLSRIGAHDAAEQALAATRAIRQRRVEEGAAEIDRSLEGVKRQLDIRASPVAHPHMP